MVELKSLVTVAVVPAGDEHAHAGRHIVTKVAHVVAAVSHHLEVFFVLAQSGADAPHVLVVSRAHKLGLDSELMVGVDHAATRTVGINAIVANTLLVHTDHAFVEEVALAIRAWLSLGLEAILVGLHDVDASTLGVAQGCGITALVILGIDQVDTSGTAALCLRQINSVRDVSTTECIYVKRIIGDRLLLSHEETVDTLNAELFILEFGIVAFIEA